MELRFKKIKKIGSYTVAVFKNNIDKSEHNFDKKNLETRIKNMKKQNMDTKQECLALDKFNEILKEKKDS